MTRVSLQKIYNHFKYSKYFLVFWGVSVDIVLLWIYLDQPFYLASKILRIACVEFIDIMDSWHSSTYALIKDYSSLTIFLLRI